MQTILLAAFWLALWQAPPDLNNHLASGYRLLDQGHLEEAYRELSIAVAAAPESVEGESCWGWRAITCNAIRKQWQIWRRL